MVMKVRQHYVPRFYLEKFAIRRKRGFIIKCFDKINQKSYVENIIKIGMENYFFDKKDPPLIEEHFAEKEYEHSKIYNKIVSQESIENINDNEKFKMCEYIFFQNERTRATRERNKQITKIVYKYLEKKEKFPKYEEMPKVTISNSFFY